MSARFPSNFWSSGCNPSKRERADDPSPLQCPHLDWNRLPDIFEEVAEEEPEPLWLGRDVALYVPESYEPNYAYPLILWLHGDGGSEGELPELMEQISPQNYLGLAFRGPLPAKSGFPLGYRWLHSERAVSDFFDPLHETVCLLRRAYHIHSERIFVAGFGSGASFALQLLLRRPEWLGGAICLGGGLPAMKSPLARFRELGGKKVLIGVGARDCSRLAGETSQTSRLLHTAGMHVTTRSYAAGHDLTPEILGYVNHWLMDGIYAAV